MIKRCSKCKIEKDINSFHKDKSSKDGYSCQCIECRKKQAIIDKNKLLLYRDKNKESKRVYDKKKYQEKREEKLIYAKQYRLNNPEKVASCKKNSVSKNPKHYKAYKHSHPEATKIWKRNNKDKVSQYSKKYNSTENGKMVRYAHHVERKSKIKSTSDGTVTAKFLRELADNTKHCIFTGIELTADNRHLDHIVPLSRGGKHSADNVRFISGKANLMKNNKLDEELVNFRNVING